MKLMDSFPDRLPVSGDFQLDIWERQEQSAGLNHLKTLQLPIVRLVQGMRSPYGMK